MTQSPTPDKELQGLLAQVAAGKLDPEQAAERIQNGIVHDLGFAQVDTHRQCRRGRPEAIFCQGKSPDQVIQIAQSLIDAGQNVLMTRMDTTMRDAVANAFTGRDIVRHDGARLMHIRIKAPSPKQGIVGVLCAGTTDIPVAEEAALTAEFLGSPVRRLFDVGVAGIHRLLRHREQIEEARVLVVVAGMEGALASVVGGLVRAPVIAVPTSVGYGASFGGVAALLAMLNSCSPGISVVNIDNGFGAGYLADAINEIGEK